MIQNTTDEIYQSRILTGVSRTFALTIPQLPEALCKVVSNGYLLCRIADTIEDEPHLTATQKKQFSQDFIEVVAGKISPNTLSQALFPLLSESTLAAEKDLIFNMSRVIRVTHSFTKPQRTALYRCVRIMAEGMAEFQQNSSLEGLKDLPEMDRYCYYVAGVVGEMLTELFCDYSPLIAQQKATLQKLAISFGQALQMTNILKDIWEDRQRGVCWLPQDVFAGVGFDLKNLSPKHYDPAFGEGLTELIGVAHAHLRNALRYTLQIPPQEKGIRRFCLWALGMAILTLRRIYKQCDFCQGQQVKISRRSVKTTILVSNLVTSNDISLRVLFYLLTRNLPIV
ncbi:phytoene/squalene synthase family protein [Candidatus Parabeggiatoa sp. HSG14]|uniref:phytoene/squalene synthase family protein n=1 Tax=Candidatus Parabeggiatoa sp. HSG14 TaxID=3055593 RepID=UPI0025A7F5B1|nr:phytoene/squalene synthase family protein [Thiotrichales bacterium HSG14]